VILEDACKQYGLRKIGELGEVREVFYAISLERNMKHPGVLAIAKNAKGELFC
jgi:LysR family transcriptional activator of nhaA